MLRPTKRPTKIPTKAPSGATCQVTGLQLFRANTDSKIVDLVNNTTQVLLQTLTNPRMTSLALNVVATFNQAGSTIQSVVFWLNGRLYSTEATPPFAMCANSGTDFKSCASNLGCGTHTVTAIPYDSRGVACQSFTATFTINCNVS
jgi:hypothetical protein